MIAVVVSHTQPRKTNGDIHALAQSWKSSRPHIWCYWSWYWSRSRCCAKPHAARTHHQISAKLVAAACWLTQQCIPICKACPGRTHNTHGKRHYFLKNVWRFTTLMSRMLMGLGLQSHWKHSFMTIMGLQTVVDRQKIGLNIYQQNTFNYDFFLLLDTIILVPWL